MRFGDQRGRFQNHACKRCGPDEGRHIGCHATCERYLTERERIQGERTEFYEAMRKDSEQGSRQREAIKQALRKRKRG